MSYFPQGFVLRVAKSLEFGGYQMYGHYRNGTELAAMQPLVFEVMSEEHTSLPCAGTFKDETALQVLMDDLWNCGIRPTEGAGTAGSMRATERHLNDMRALLSKQLKTELP